MLAKRAEIGWNEPGNEMEIWIAPYPKMRLNYAVKQLRCKATSL